MLPYEHEKKIPLKERGKLDLLSDSISRGNFKKIKKYRSLLRKYDIPSSVIEKSLKECLPLIDEEEVETFRERPTIYVTEKGEGTSRNPPLRVRLNYKLKGRKLERSGNRYMKKGKKEENIDLLKEAVTNYKEARNYFLKAGDDKAVKRINSNIRESKFRRSLEQIFKDIGESKFLGILLFLASIIFFSFSKDSITGYSILTSSGNLNYLMVLGVLFFITALILLIKKKKP